MSHHLRDIRKSNKMTKKLENSGQGQGKKMQGLCNPTANVRFHINDFQNFSYL